MSGPAPKLTKAVALHQAGRVVEARAMYERLLRRQPRDPDVLNFLGMLEFQSGDRQRGVDRLQASLAIAPRNAHAWLNLGNMHYALDDAAAAADAYGRTTEFAPQMWQGWFHRSVALRRLRRFEESADCLRTVLRLKPDHDEAYERLGLLLYRAGRADELEALYAEWVRHRPDHPVARHLHAAAIGGSAVPERASDDYVRKVFDEFAGSFDDNLEDLLYRAPQLLVDALRRHIAEVPDGLDVLDAGAGTGLCGPLLRPSARTLVGVDLSSGMLDKARERGCYDELVVGELCEFMRGRPAAFDVVLSADTLVYFGALEDALAAARHCLRPRGWLFFTVESLEANENDGAVRFRMGAHGRYLHSHDFVAAALDAAGFEQLEISPDVLRTELGADVAGYVVAARRKE